MSRLSRRTFLRGLVAGGGAAAIGLPLLDAMTNARASTPIYPPRFVQWFWGNGSHPGGWAPTTTGPGWTADGLLRGLAGVRDHVHVVSGTVLPVRGRNNPHVEGAAGILTGGNPVVDPAYATAGNDWDYLTVAGPSLDEVAADIVGTPHFRSLVVAVTPPHGVNGPGTAVRYTSHRAPYLYNEPTFDPLVVFDQLFGAHTPDPLRASVLDAVLADAKDLERRLGAADRERLGVHLDAVRDLEVRVRSGSVGLQCDRPSPPLSTESYRERAKLFADLAAAAFVCDLTRVFSMEFSSPASHEGYPDIFPGALMFNGSPTSFHEYEHNVGYDEAVLTGLTYFVDVLGDFIAALRDMPEGEGTVLDHALVFGTSEVAGGQDHAFHDFPLIIAGGANGRIRQPGTHVALPGGIATRVPLTCLRALQPDREAWGTEQYRVTEAVGELLV